MDSLLLFLLLIFAPVFLLMANTTTRKRRRLPPGPTPWPLVGSLPAMLLNRPHFRWVLRVADGNDITCIRLGDVHTIVVNSPDLGREFLKKHDASFASRPLTMATEYSGRGFVSVVVAPWGDQWKKMRRIVTSEVLSPARLRQQEALRHDEADHLVRCVYSLCQQRSPVIDVRQIVRHYCGNVIRRIMFGRRRFGEEKKPGLPGKEEVEHVDAAFDILSVIYAFCPSDFMPSLRFLDLNGHERMARRAMKVMDKYHDPIILERVRRWRGEDASLSGPKDILDVLISLKDDDGKWLLTVEEIKAQSAELIFATVDNPSNVAEWALAHMMDQPETMRKAVEELDRVVGKGRLVQESDFPQLVYVKACAREALRLHPVAPFNLPHVAMRDAEVAGYFIPKGSQVLVSRVGLGRNPKVWGDAPRFDPERHLNAGPVELAEPQLRFISFATGRRGCMGYALGSMMTYMLLARLIQTFEWSLAPGETCIDLSEEKTSMFMARPLRVCATLRMPCL